MKIASILAIAFIALLSIAAGMAKVMQAPQEIRFLTELGLNNALILLFGCAQVIGGVLTAIPRTKLFGSLMATLGFLLSAVLIFISGNIPFGLASLLPVIISGLVTYQAFKATRGKAMHVTSE